MVRTSAEMREVFPVPAYPHSKKTLRPSSDKMKSDNFSIVFSCSTVALNGKFNLICEVKYLFITFIGKKKYIRKVYSFFYLIFVTRK